MKKKIFSIFGVALTLVLVVSLFGFAVPASAQLPPKDLEWSRVSTPSSMTKQLAAGTDAAFLTLAPDGTTVFAVDTTAAIDLVYKSTTSGRTWAASTTNPWGAAAITALAVSPAFATDKTVIVGAKDAVTNCPQVYVSIDGGTTFAALGGNISATTTEVITSLAISPIYSGGIGEIMLGTVDTAGAGAMGNVYIWGRLGVLNWVAQGLNEDITSAVFSPNYPIDATILAIGTNVAGIGTTLHTQVGAAAWNATIGIPAAGATTIDNTTTEVGAVPGTSDIISSAIAVGSDFNGSVLTTHRVYVALVSDRVDDVYQVYMIGPGATVNAMGAGPGDNEYTSLAYSGDFAAGNLLAGNDAYTAGVGTTATVVRCANPTLTMAWLWIGATTPPTGTAAVESADTFTIIDATGVGDGGNISVAGTGSVVATPTGTATVAGGSVPVTINLASGAVAWTVTAATDTIIVQAATPYTTGGWTVGAAATASITNDVRWYPASVAAAGGAFNLPDSAGPLTYVVMAPDFATSNKVFAGTMGTESALSVSDDGGVNFYQAGLIDTAITNIQDFQPSPDYANDNTMFLAAANTAGPESLWRTTDGSAWYRVLTLATANDTAIVRLSPEFATDQTLYFAETGAGTTAIRMSSNGGATWSPRIASVAIADMVVEDANTIYVGGATSGVVSKSITGGWTWIIPATTISYAGMTMPAVNCMARDAATGYIMAGTPMGIVWLSMDKGVTFIPAGTIAGYPNISLVAFDGNFATNKMLYCASSTVPGIYRAQFMAETSFKRIDAVAGLVAGDLVGMACAADGTLYAADKRGAAVGPPVLGGVLRSITPTAQLTPIDLVSGSFESVSVADGLTATYALDSVVVAEGSNKAFAILHFVSMGVTSYAVYMYIDTLTTVSPEMVSPADGAISATPNTVIVSWGAVTGATSYDYQVSNRSDFADLAGVPTANVAAPGTSAWVNLVFPEGSTLYWRVRAAAPVMGPWSSGWSFSTQLTTAVNAPAPLSPAPATYTHVNVALAPVFNWSSLKWATGYELQLAKDAAFKSLIVNLTGAKALGNVTSYQLTEDLAYSTTCYWRVRGISATGSSDWSAGSGFTTMAKPVEAAPPVVVEEYQPPDIIVEIPPAEAPVSPGWIWAIVIIGAVLVIAVIVLIVRTRRPV